MRRFKAGTRETGSADITSHEDLRPRPDHFLFAEEVAALAWHIGPFTFGLHPASSVFFLLTAHQIPCGLHPPSKPLSLMHLSLCLWAKPFPLSGVPGSSCISLQPYFQVPRQITSPKETFLSFPGRQKILHCLQLLLPASPELPHPGPRPSHHDGHTSGGIPLPNHPLLPRVRCPGRGCRDTVAGGAEGSAHGQCAPLHGDLGPEGAVLHHTVVPGGGQEPGQPDLL